MLGAGVITVRIERLVLEGFGRVDGERVRHSVESELARLIDENGLPDGVSRVSLRSSIAAGTLGPGGDEAEKLGVRIARQVYEGLSR